MAAKRSAKKQGGAAQVKKQPKPAAKKKAKPATKPRAAAKKRRTKTAVPGKPTAPSKAEERAAVLAAKVPLVHYPASDRFEEWADGQRRWLGLQSRSARGCPEPSENFARLRWDHVFSYAGPSCYFKRDSVGNALLYVWPEDAPGNGGGASPFDSGALEDPEPKLRPWSQTTLDERWAFFQQHAVPLGGWRARFQRWLAASYEEPDRYLEATPDRHGAGQPDRLDPPDILEHNGVRGRIQYGDDCADRRAWTWEVRVEREIPWRAVRAVHLPFSLMQAGTEWAERVESVHGNLPDVRTLPPGQAADFDGLYAASGATLKEMVGA